MPVASLEDIASVETASGSASFDDVAEILPQEKIVAEPGFPYRRPQPPKPKTGIADIRQIESVVPSESERTFVKDEMAKPNLGPLGPTPDYKLLPDMPKPPVPSGLRPNAPLESPAFRLAADVGEATPGLQSIIGGTEEAVKGARRIKGDFPWSQGFDKRYAQGASEIFRGGMEAGTPLMGAGLARGTLPLLRTAAMVGTGGLVQPLVEKGARGLGFGEGTSALAGDVAGILGGAWAGRAPFGKPTAEIPRTAEAPPGVMPETPIAPPAEAAAPPSTPSMEELQAMRDQLLGENTKLKAKAATSSQIPFEQAPPPGAASVETVAPSKPLWEMNPAELDAAHAQAKGADDQLLVNLFGDANAKLYNKLQRTANTSNDPARADVAAGQIEQMEQQLTEEQRNKLYGIGETGPTPDEIHGYRKALGQVDTTSPEALGDSLKWATTKVGTNPDPLQMTPEQRVSYAQLRHGYEQAGNLGYDPRVVSRGAIAGAGERFNDPNDAQYMLEHFLNKGKTSEPSSQQLPEAPWNPPASSPAGPAPISPDNLKYLTDDQLLSAADKGNHLGDIAEEFTKRYPEFNPRRTVWNGLTYFNRGDESGKTFDTALEAFHALVDEARGLKTIDVQAEPSELPEAPWAQRALPPSSGPVSISPERQATQGGALQIPAGARQYLQNMMGRGQQPQATPTPPAAPEFDTVAQGLKREWIDKFAPLAKLEEMSPVPTDFSAYVAARNFAGRMGKVENRLNELRDILPERSAMPSDYKTSPYGLNPEWGGNPDLKAMTELGTLDRHEELFNRLPGYQTPEGDTLATIQQKRAALEQQLGPQKTADLQGRLDRLYDYQRKILEQVKDAGVISQESFDAITAAGRNEKYLPLQRIAYIEDQLDKSMNTGSTAFSVASQNLVREIKGSSQELLDPIQGVVRNTIKAVNLIERNIVAKKMADLSQRPEYQSLVKPLRGQQAPPRGMDGFSVLENGVKKRYAVPQEVADAMKGMNAEKIDFATRWAAKSASALRAGATSLNPPFLVANALRDFQTATVASKVGFTPLDWVKGFAEAVNPGSDYKRFLESGGSFSGIFQQQKSLPHTVSALTQSGTARVLHIIANPIELLRTASEAVEMAPRLGVFKRSLAQGTSDLEAGYNARNATVDFSRVGDMMKTVNMWVPFLNARTQGTLNFFGAIKDRPVSSTFKLGVLVGLPIVATNIWNHEKYPEVIKDIAEYEKDNNFILVLGDKKDQTGHYSQVVKIPKGEVQAFAGPLENYIDFMREQDHKSYSKLAMETASNISPVPFEREGHFDTSKLLGGIIPPTPKAAIEGAFNKNFFTGRPIVPDRIERTGASLENQYTKDTPSGFVKAAKGLATVGLPVSPMKLQNAMTTQFGGLGRSISEPSKALANWGGRFAAAKGGEVEQKEFQKLNVAKEAVGNVNLDVSRQAETIFDTVNKEPIATRRAKLQELLSPLKPEASETEKLDRAKLTNELEKVIKRRVTDETAFDRSFLQKPIDVRAGYLMNRLRDTPPAEQRQLFDKWKEKGFITERVDKEMGDIATREMEAKK